MNDLRDALLACNACGNPLKRGERIVCSSCVKKKRDNISKPLIEVTKVCRFVWVCPVCDKYHEYVEMLGSTCICDKCHKKFYFKIKNGESKDV